MVGWCCLWRVRGHWRAWRGRSRYHTSSGQFYDPLELDGDDGDNDNDEDEGEDDNDAGGC